MCVDTSLTKYYYYYYYSHIFLDSRAQHCNYATVLAGRSYQVSPDKKEALANIPLPTGTKQARLLLGKGVFFSGFTPGYSDLW